MHRSQNRLFWMREHSSRAYPKQLNRTCARVQSHQKCHRGLLRIRSVSSRIELTPCDIVFCRNVLILSSNPSVPAKAKCSAATARAEASVCGGRSTTNSMVWKPNRRTLAPKRSSHDLMMTLSGAVPRPLGAPLHAPIHPIQCGTSAVRPARASPRRAGATESRNRSCSTGPTSSCSGNASPKNCAPHGGDHGQEAGFLVLVVLPVRGEVEVCVLGKPSRLILWREEADRDVPAASKDGADFVAAKVLRVRGA